MLVSDMTDKDRYGRLLRYVFVDGIFVNAALLLTGQAQLLLVDPDIRFASLLQACETQTQVWRVGMWR